LFAVADEESGSAHGARWIADNAPDAIRADYVLTESGGLHTGPPEAPAITVNVGEKGVAWRRLRVRGTPGHGSAPYKADNALVKAAAVVQRLSQYRPAPKVHELWGAQVSNLPLDDDTKRLLMDPARIDEVLDSLPPRAASHLYSCTHTTFSCNELYGSMKTNVIPDCVELGVDVRTLPGEDHTDVDRHLRAALGDAYEGIEVEVVMNDPASISRVGTPVWDSLQRAVGRQFPTSTLTAQLIVGFTDARVFREMGSVAYGAGLFSPDLDPSEYGKRFHGNDERVDIESLRLVTQLWIDVARDLLG
jgi:acetylornithine deacetylase/succinyl-diaminopimelate desuccinylase-like protein